MSVCLQDGKSVVSGSDDETVRVWDAATGKEVQKLEGHSDYVNSVSFSPVRVCGSRVRGSCGRRGGRGRCGTCVVELVCWGQVNVVLRCVVRPRPAAACVCVVCMLACAFVCGWWFVLGFVGVCVVVEVIQLSRACVMRAALWAAWPARAVVLEAPRRSMRGVWCERGLCCCACWVQRVAGTRGCVWWIEW